jgi:hypothetical protein
MLYKILPNALRSNNDPRQKLEPHVDGIIGSANVKSTDLVTSQLKEFSLSQSVGGQAFSVSSTPTQSTNVHSVQSTNNHEGIKIKDLVTIIRVGGIRIIYPWTT